jgi:L-threonylcarbamoyladenylate synthase
MQVLSTSDKDLEWAAASLVDGCLVAFPTETVYGLGADAYNLSALARIFEAKNRPFFDPLIIHITEMDALFRVADESALSEAARERLSILSKKLWPGPLTMILPKRSEIPDLATAGFRTVAVRFPSHPVAQKLIRLSTGVVAAPSANPFGCLSPTRAEHVETQLGDKVDFIINGGRTQVGLESTVLDLTRDTPAILRHGGTSRETIEALIGPVNVSLESSLETTVSPGQLKSHYAPLTSLVLCGEGELDAIPLAPDEGRRDFAAPKNGNRLAPERIRVLSEIADLTEAAANLFDMLHELDSLGLGLIRAEKVPGSGLGEAINDRLRRAQSASG